MVTSVTSTLFFPTGKFVDAKAKLEEKRELHDAMVVKLLASKVSEIEK